MKQASIRVPCDFPFVWSLVAPTGDFKVDIVDSWEVAKMLFELSVNTEAANAPVSMTLEHLQLQG